MTGQMALRALRQSLGWTQLQVSRETMISVRTIRRIEQGLVQPIPDFQHKLISLAYTRVPDALPDGIRRVVINPDNMRKYTGGPGPQWREWSRKRRGQWRRWKLYYDRILADSHAGRVLVVYEYRDKARTPQALLARALDAAPAIDT
jgi:transcriptional regulator with XRE-family HTH domain